MESVSSKPNLQKIPYRYIEENNLVTPGFTQTSQTYRNKHLQERQNLSQLPALYSPQQQHQQQSSNSRVSMTMPTGEVAVEGEQQNHSRLNDEHKQHLNDYVRSNDGNSYRQYESLGAQVPNGRSYEARSVAYEPSMINGGIERGQMNSSYSQENGIMYKYNPYGLSTYPSNNQLSYAPSFSSQGPYPPKQAVYYDQANAYSAMNANPSSNTQIPPVVHRGSIPAYNSSNMPNQPGFEHGTNPMQPVGYYSVGQVPLEYSVSKPQQPKRMRRRHDMIERIYNCGYNGCKKSYGTLNHLNAHVQAQKHGPKRLPEEFKEIRAQWKAKKKAEEELRRISMRESLSRSSASSIPEQQLNSYTYSGSLRQPVNELSNGGNSMTGYAPYFPHLPNSNMIPDYNAQAYSKSNISYAPNSGVPAQLPAISGRNDTAKNYSLASPLYVNSYINSSNVGQNIETGSGSIPVHSADAAENQVREAPSSFDTSGGLALYHLGQRRDNMASRNDVSIDNLENYR